MTMAEEEAHTSGKLGWALVLVPVCVGLWMHTCIGTNVCTWIKS